MLIFGGIPWNCYFQRVLSCRTPRDAKRQSILAGVLTIAFTVPPLLMGIAAFAYPWPADIVVAAPGDAGRRDAAAVRASGAARRSACSAWRRSSAP